MRLLFITVIFLVPPAASAQDCIQTTNISVKICRSLLLRDSLCSPCPGCRPMLVAADSRFSIISFHLVAGDIDGCAEECSSNSPFLDSSPVKKVIEKTKINSFVYFSCIKARDVNTGKIYTLEPLYFEIRQ